MFYRIFVFSAEWIGYYIVTTFRHFQESKDSIMFENLFQFWACYLNQDFDMEFETWQDAVKQFIAENDVSTIRLTIEELNQLIDLNLSEEDLGRRILSLGCYYYAPGSGDGPSQKEWITLCRDELVRLNEMKVSKER